MQFKSYNYNLKRISDVLSDDSGTKYLWVAFDKDTDGICHLYKVSAHNPLQIYYDLELEVEAINKLYIDGNYIYLALDDSQYIGYRYSKGTPLTSYLAIDLPSGISEAPIDLVVKDSYIYFLLPGIISGTIASIVKMSVSGTLDEIIELQKSGEIINNAKSITIDTNDNIWIVTNESPSKLVRVYETSGGVYTFDTKTLIV